MAKQSKLSEKLLQYKASQEADKRFFGIEESTQEWKSPGKRQELFNRYFNWRVLTHDLDHIHYYKYLCKDYDFEQKAWFAFCFGMTYRTPQAFAYTETFPDFHAINMNELEKWHANNWKRTTYGTDARYNKGHWVSQVQSVKNWLGKSSFKDKFDSILVGSSQRENFWLLYREIQTLHKFGRMTGWLLMQCLHDLLELPIDPEDIMLDGYSPNNDSSLGSIWNGLCALTNQPEKMIGKYGDYQVVQKDVEWAKDALLEYTSIAEEFSGFRIDSFRKESIYCQYKRMFAPDGSSGEMPGHASSDATSRYLYYREHWPEIDWKPFRSALRNQPGLIKGAVFPSWYDSVFGVTGELMNMHELFPDMPNGFETLLENPFDYKVKEIWEDDGLVVPTSSDFQKELQETDKWFKVL
ncbi:hypothetical protein [Caulobacter phage Cr30]|uniref:hypothetical protein n=1 Tax=Caulobacter phage Cr30 TaxID=1357714 RepID=UPI0004A9B74F|nr:hypothetical protein OZ74_gp123 [Caulobacter phage Cr30]AGS81008.1 hypothetical protein [Caulobacter phage Cr30]